MILTTKRRTLWGLSALIFIAASIKWIPETVLVRTVTAKSLKPHLTTSITPIEESTKSPWRSISNETVVIEPTDVIYTWNAPIVLESHKLIFFPVAKSGSSNWKKMFRRILGYKDWYSANPHKRKTNGLRFLNQYNITRATEIMNSHEYTRAMFVRDPKARILSAHRDKVIQNHLYIEQKTRCCPSGECPEIVKTFAGFLRMLQQCHNECCNDVHWQPQSRRVERKFLEKIDFIGHLKTAHEDAKLLLQHIGAWEEFGESGWGEYRNESFMQSLSTSGRRHVTSSREHLAEYFTPELERIVEDMYASDYEVFNLPVLNVSQV